MSQRYRRRNEARPVASRTAIPAALAVKVGAGVLAHEGPEAVIARGQLARDVAGAAEVLTAVLILLLKANSTPS